MTVDIFYLQLSHCPLTTNLIDLMSVKELNRLEASSYGQVKFDALGLICVNLLFPFHICLILMQNESNIITHHKFATMHLKICNFAVEFVVMVLTFKWDNWN